MLFHKEESHMMNFWIDMFGSFWWIFMVFGWILYFFVSVVISYYIHKDAVRRGIHNSEFWLIMGFVFNLFGLILYLIVRDNYNITNTQENLNSNQ